MKVKVVVTIIIIIATTTMAITMAIVRRDKHYQMITVVKIAGKGVEDGSVMMKMIKDGSVMMKMMIITITITTIMMLGL